MRWIRTLVAVCVLGEAISVHAAKKKKYGKRCEGHDDCKSGFCNGDSTCGCAMGLDVKTFCPKSKQICVENIFNSLDHVCALPQLKANNEECKDPLECVTTFCSQAYKKKLCTLTPGAKNSPCRSNTHCRQGYECSTGESGSLGKCIVSGCTTAADCPAGKFCNEKAKCVDVLRPGDDCAGEDERCSSGQCLEDKCTCTVSSNNACRSPFVCHESLCKLPRGKRCSSNDDCLSTVCNPNRECGCDNDHDACPSDKSCIRSPRDNFVCRKNIAAFGVKADGEECEQGNECIGNFCVNLKCSSNGGALNDSCFRSEDCAHGLECTSLSRTTHTCKVVKDGLCGSDDDCIDGHCVNNQCHVNDGGHFSSCTESSDCADGLDCSGKKCRWLADNSCTRGADCFSRRCVKNFCHVNDGGFDESCEEDNDCEGTHQCRNQKCKKAVDESCAANDDCFSEFCVNSKCHENDGSLGDACAMNNDCEGSTLECAEDRTCKRVDDEKCDAASECLGGNCVKNQCHSHPGQLKDSCVNSDDCGDTLECNASPKICLQSNDEECETNDECLSSFCVNAKCHENDGGYNKVCYSNFNCGTFLGCRKANGATQGKCRYNNGRPCTADWQCLNAFCVSGQCHSNDGSLNKVCNNGQDCEEGLQCVADSCKWSENETCKSSDDCSTEFCVNDKCHTNNGELGDACAEDDDCEGSALECDGTCKRVDDETCNAASECLGGNCVNNQCHSHPGQLKDSCVNSNDCGDTLECNASPKICLQSNNKECGTNDECLSSFCVNGKCHENDGGYNKVCQKSSDCGQFFGCKLASDDVGAEGVCKFHNARPCVGNGQCLSGFCIANKCNPHHGGLNMACDGQSINCNANHECLLSEEVCRRVNGMPCNGNVNPSIQCASEYCSPDNLCQDSPATL